jgi:hypothetical protein
LNSCMESRPEKKKAGFLCVECLEHIDILESNSPHPSICTFVKWVNLVWNSFHCQISPCLTFKERRACQTKSERCQIANSYMEMYHHSKMMITIAICVRWLIWLLGNLSSKFIYLLVFGFSLIFYHV